MTDRRALLTDREREIIAGEADVADSYRYQTISRIRARFDRLEGDLDALEKHGDLADELRGIVCSTTESAPETAEKHPTPASDPRGETDESRRDEAVEVEEPAVDGVGALELPAGVDRDEAVEAIHAARDFIEAEGGASMREIVTSVGRTHPLKYDPPEEIESGERYRGAYWRRVLKPGLEALDDVEPPATGASDWRYTGEANTDEE